VERSSGRISESCGTILPPFSSFPFDQLRQTTFADFRKLELLEKIIDFLQIPHVTPLGFSQQFEAQHSLPEQVYYVALSSSMSRRLSARTKRSGYRPTLLGQVRKALPCSPAVVPWLSRLQAIAEDPRNVREACWAISPPPRWTSSKAFLGEWGNLILGDSLSILSGLLIRPMWRRRGIAPPRQIRILRPASPQTLPNSTRRRRR